MGDIDKPAATGIDQPVFLFTQPDKIFYRPQRAVVVTMLTQRIERQDITNLIDRDRHPNRSDMQIIAKSTARTQRFRRRQLADHRFDPGSGNDR